MKMRFKYRVKTALQFMSFAFYPKITLIACLVFSSIVIAILGIVMVSISHESSWYNLVFALTTGATGSFFVSIVVELSNNYRHNKLAWHELQDYYSIVTEYENMKQVLMQHSPSQKVEKKAQAEFAAAGGVVNLDEEDRPQDLIQATWEQLPVIIPVLKKTLVEKKAFLSDTEINELRSIMTDFGIIRSQIKFLVMMSPIMHNIVNHPDQAVLENYYSKNVLADMPDWIREQIAANESKASMERLIDAILSDGILLARFMGKYDISQHGLDSYKSKYDDEEFGSEELDFDNNDFSEPEDEEEFRALHDAQDKKIVEEKRPFVSWIISKCCSNIAESIDILERSILRKPYYSINLEFDRNAEKSSLDNNNSKSSKCRSKKI